MNRQLLLFIAFFLLLLSWFIRFRYFLRTWFAHLRTKPSIAKRERKNKSRLYSFLAFHKSISLFPVQV